MTPECWRQIEQIYHSALELEESQRPSFLKEACGVTRNCAGKSNRCSLIRTKLRASLKCPLWKPLPKAMTEGNLSSWWDDRSAPTRFVLCLVQVGWERSIGLKTRGSVVQWR